ncbi:MAG: CDP-glycerol glycerophosphotransferase family protein, partial [Acidobacteriia bacterium]|nr:CDP-glycerol glycerophosphotransferase family protein [Terriglobia bacterium]
NRYLVWNRHNAAELCRAYPHVPQSDIEIVGSPQFDFYYSQAYLWEEAEWRRRLSLPQDAPVILFGGGHHFCAPHEPNFLLQLDDAIENNEISKRAVILFRCHPVDPIGRWLPVLQKTRHVIRDDPWKLTGASGQVNVRGSDIQKLASTLYYSRVHVNVASTMAVDGAIMDRPQVGPAYDDTPGRRFDRTARELYLQEHYLPITRSGGLEIVRDRRALVKAVRDGLEHSTGLGAGRKRLVREICTYDDGHSTDRVFRAVLSFLGEKSAVTSPLVANVGSV